MSIWIILAVIAGTVLPIQAGVNASLAKHLDSSPQAGLISFTGGLLLMILFCFCARQNFPSLKQVLSAPPYLLVGGFLGGIMVITSIIVAPKIGAVALIGSLVAGQLIFSVIVDHFGWVGFPIHRINAMRIVGILLLFVGVLLIHRF